jgi:hypothetical protein
MKGTMADTAEPARTGSKILARRRTGASERPYQFETHRAVWRADAASWIKPLKEKSTRHRWKEGANGAWALRAAPSLRFISKVDEN